MHNRLSSRLATTQEKTGKLEDRILVTKLKHTEKKN